MDSNHNNPLSELSYKVEVWSADDRRLEKTLAIIGTITLARRFIFAIQSDYTGKRLIIRKGIRQVWPA